jgi:hypothetical protein
VRFADPQGARPVHHGRRSLPFPVGARELAESLNQIVQNLLNSFLFLRVLEKVIQRFRAIHS